MKIIQFYNTNGTEKYSITLLCTIYYLIFKQNPKNDFRYYTILIKGVVQRVFHEIRRGV